MTEKKKLKNIHLRLFLNTLKLSAFTFGGGYVIISLMRKRCVEQLGWLDEEEMLDLTALAQSSPGAVAVNASILLGYRLAGITGALVTVLGTILPPLVILFIISFFYRDFRDNAYVGYALKGMQAGVAAVICDVVVSMAAKIIGRKRLLYDVMMLAVFAAVFFVGVNIIPIIGLCAAIGIADVLISRKRGRL